MLAPTATPNSLVFSFIASCLRGWAAPSVGSMTAARTVAALAAVLIGITCAVSTLSPIADAYAASASYDAGTSRAITASSSVAPTEDWFSENFSMQVTHMSAGFVDYDEASKTMTLNNVVADQVYLGSGATLALVGENHISNGVFTRGQTGALRVQGPGSLEGEISSESDLIMLGGSIAGYAHTDGNFSMSGGSISNSGPGATISVGGDFSMSGGSIASRGCTGIEATRNAAAAHSFVISGGSIDIVFDEDSYSGISLFESAFGA